MVVDIIVLVILLISAAIAFMRGFIREVLTIAGVAGGALAAYMFGPSLVPVVEGWLGVEPDMEEIPRLFDILPYDLLAKILAFGMIFIIVVIVLSIISHFLAEGARNLGLGAIDRTLGVIFGLARGLLFLGVFYLPFYALAEQDTRDRWFDGSHTHFYIEKTAALMSGFLPEKTTEDLEGGENKMREVLEKAGAVSALTKGEKNNAPENDQQKNEIKKGYDEDFRTDMDALIEEQINKNGAR